MRDNATFLAEIRARLDVGRGTAVTKKKDEKIDHYVDEETLDMAYLLAPVICETVSTPSSFAIYIKTINRLRILQTPADAKPGYLLTWRSRPITKAGVKTKSTVEFLMSIHKKRFTLAAIKGNKDLGIIESGEGEITKEAIEALIENMKVIING